MLTRRQKELLEYIQSYFDGFGYTPSYDEMRIATGVASKSGIHRLVNALEERGYIRRLPNRARAIEILKGAQVTEELELLRRINMRQAQQIAELKSKVEGLSQEKEKLEHQCAEAAACS